MSVADIEWSDQYNVGSPRIDLEHRIFLSLIITIQRRWDFHQDSELIQRLITELEYYTRFHFVSEENLMTEIGFPDLDLHKEHHYYLLDELNIHKHQLQSLKIDVNQFVDFLASWFFNHTASEDQAIGIYLRETGIDSGMPLIL